MVAITMLWKAASETLTRSSNFGVLMGAIFADDPRNSYYGRYIADFLNLRAFPMTETELSAIAAAATMGLSNSPVAG